MLDRTLQIKILETLQNRYPGVINLFTEVLSTENPNLLAFNLSYLEEHELVRVFYESIGLQTSWGGAKLHKEHTKLQQKV